MAAIAGGAVYAGTASGELIALNLSDVIDVECDTAEAEPNLQGAQRAEWLDRLARDADNLRLVLDWCVNRGGDCEIGARMAGALDQFWNYAGRMSEGRKWLVGVLAPGAGANG